MLRLLSNPITYIVSILMLVGLALFVASMIYLRRARRGSYWRMRRAAGQRGGQLFLISVTLMGIALTIAFFSGFAAIAIDEVNQFFFGTPNPFPGIALPTATFTPNFPTPDVEGTVSAILAATGDALATQAAATQAAILPTSTPSSTSTPTGTGTASVTPPPTSTPTPTFDSVLRLTPPASTLQPRPDSAIGITSASAALPADYQPVDPAESFPAGVTRIYFFFDFRSMDDGLTWTRILYREGVPVQGGAYTWTQGAEGAGFFFFGRDDGYPPGSYEVRVFLGSTEVSRFRFTILPIG